MECLCELCGNAVFDPTWGEWKCLAEQHRVYHPGEIVDCENYKKGEPHESKREYEPG